jgi:ProP effector
MSSLPPSSTPTEGDDSTLAPLTAAAPATESPVAAEAAPAGQPAATGAEAAPAEQHAADQAASDEQPAVETAAEQPAAKPAQEDCGPQLKKLYPALFSNPPKPLKLRIQADIQARSPGEFTKAQLSAFLRRYTGSHAYLNALVKATHRYDLDGVQGDELSDEHRAAATEELARRRANTQARNELEAEQRANRATLLKEYEANTLPAAEFAAAKGIPEAELEPLVARARKEAAEPPPAPAFNRRDRRGPPQQQPRGPRADGPRRDGPRKPRPPRQAEGGAPAVAGEAAGQAEAPRAPRPPRNDAPRTDRPRHDGVRADGPRGDGQRPPRPQGPRADGPRGPRPEGQRGADNRPRQDGPRPPRRDDDRRPPRDDARGPRPSVASKPEGPTAMQLAFSALRGLDVSKTKK